MAVSQKTVEQPFLLFGSFDNYIAIHQIGTGELTFNGYGMFHQVSEDHSGILALDGHYIAHNDGVIALFVLIDSGKAHSLPSLYIQAGQNSAQPQVALFKIGNSGHNLLVSGVVAGLIQLHSQFSRNFDDCNLQECNKALLCVQE